MRSVTGARARLLLLLLAAVCLAFPAGSRAAAPAAPKSVLILLAGQPGLPASVAIATGVRASLAAVPALEVSVETEHVDTARFKSPADEERRLREMMRAKYAGRPFDLVVVASNEPLGFFLRARDTLWPRIPAIVCAVDERSVTGFKAPAGVTLVTIRYDMEGTLRAAVGLLPDTRRVALLGGIAPQDRRFQEFARQAVRTSGDRLELIDLTGLPMPAVLERVARLPERTIVLISTIQMDGSGRRFYGVDVIGPLTAASNRPLFSALGPLIGLGVVGGSVVDFGAVGREAGALALRALLGEALPRSAIASAASTLPRFDGRQLRRWGLDEGRLPAGSDVLFPQPGLWQQYRWRILALTALVVLEGALIVTLILERRHQRIQARLAGRLRFETLVAEISRTFAGLPAGRVDEHIRECLRRMVLFLGVDRGALWLPVGDSTLLKPSHVFALEGTPPPDSIDLARYPYLHRVTAQGLPFTFDHVSRLPEDSAAEREAFERLGITSYAALPLRIGEHTLGFLTFVKLGGERDWPEEVTQQVRTLAELFANALSRKQAASALEDSEAFTSAVLAALPGETAIVDVDGVIVQVNDAWAAFVRTAPFDLQVAISVGGNYLKALQRPVRMPPDLARKARELLDSVLQGRQVEASLEYPSLRGDEERYFELRVRRVARPGGGAAVMHFDVTARRRAEAAAQRHLSEIAHLDRVAGMGQLASSIAHELNQPLTAILTNAQAAQRLMRAAQPDLAELREMLTDIVHDDQRAAEVIRRMRNMLRKDELMRLPVDLNELAANTIALVANDALLHYVTLDFAPARALPTVHGDLVQIQQVILNLLSNAITAAANGPTSQRRVLVWTSTAVASSVELGVHDSGKGIPSSDLERLFEPFFTTRAEGLGMGLAISRSIVEAHGGTIVAENDPAGGAAFRVRLPVAQPEPT